MKFGTRELTLGTVFVGLFGIGALALYNSKQTSDMAKKINLSVADLSSRTPVDIQQHIVDKAIERAVDREVYKAAHSAAVEVGKAIRADMDGMIRKDVDAVYSDMKGKVEDHVTELVSKIDIDDIKSGVKNKVVDKIAKEFGDWVGLGRLFGSGNSKSDLSGLKDVLNTLPSYERSAALREFARIR